MKQDQHWIAENLLKPNIYCRETVFYKPHPDVHSFSCHNNSRSCAKAEGVGGGPPYHSFVAHVDKESLIETWLPPYDQRFLWSSRGPFSRARGVRDQTSNNGRGLLLYVWIIQPRHGQDCITTATIRSHSKASPPKPTSYQTASRGPQLYLATVWQVLL